MLFQVALAILIAAVIFFTAVYLWKFRRPSKVQHLLLDDCQTVTVEEHQIVYCQKGVGPDLLLIHGLGSSKYCWVDIYDRLSKHYRVTALDLPGFGQSDKLAHADYGYSSQIHRLRLFCEKLNLKDVVAVGCSMGGTLALGLAFEHPEFVKRLVLISPAVEPRLAAKAPRQFSWFLALFGHWLAHPLLVEGMAKNVFLRPEKLTPQMIQHYYSPYHRSRPAVLAFWKGIDVVRDFPHTQNFSNLQKPTLLLFGEKDRITPWWSVESLEKQAPSLVVRRNPDGGHHLMEDQPDFVIAAIEEFIGSHPQQN